MARKTTVQAEGERRRSSPARLPDTRKPATTRKVARPPAPSRRPARNARINQGTPGWHQGKFQRGLQAESLSESLSAPPRFASPDSLSMVTVIHP